MNPGPDILSQASAFLMGTSQGQLLLNLGASLIEKTIAQIGQKIKTHIQGPPQQHAFRQAFERACAAMCATAYLNHPYNRDAVFGAIRDGLIHLANDQEFLGELVNAACIDHPLPLNRIEQAIEELRVSDYLTNINFDVAKCFQAFHETLATDIRSLSAEGVLTDRFVTDNLVDIRDGQRQNLQALTTIKSDVQQVLAHQPNEIAVADTLCQRFAEYSTHNLQARSVILEEHVTRTEIHTIVETLRSGKHVLITAGPGEGKTGIMREVALHLTRSGNVVLFIDALGVAQIRNLAELRDTIATHSSLFLHDQVRSVGLFRDCFVIIDQIDSIRGLPAERELLDSIQRMISATSHVHIVVASRPSSDADNPSFSEFLATFTAIELSTIESDRLAIVLASLGITPSDWENAPLTPNLLTLSLFARIKQANPALQFRGIRDDVNLWDTFLSHMCGREPGLAPSAPALNFQNEAISLAYDSLVSEGRKIRLEGTDSKWPIHQRLLSWEILERVAGKVYRFRHEEFSDFLVARDACDNLRQPSELLVRLSRHRLSGIIKWIDKIHSSGPLETRQEFLSEYLSNASGLTTHARLELLERYIRTDISPIQPIALAIWRTICTDNTLLRYFFNQTPHVSWARILHEEQAFTNPPVERGPDSSARRHYYWHAQAYLIAVADQIPEIVIEHLKVALPFEVYQHGAMRAVERIGAEHLPQTAKIISGVYLASAHLNTHGIDLYMGPLFERLLGNNLRDSAFGLFTAMTSPVVRSVRPGGMYSSGSTRIEFAGAPHDLDMIAKYLTSLDHLQVLTILETQFGKRLNLNDQALYEHFSTSWRSTIVQTEIHYSQDPVHILFSALRDALIRWAETDSTSIQPHLRDLLGSDRPIFRRLALHVLTVVPHDFLHISSTILKDPSVLDYNSARYEVGVLLSKATPLLSPSEQCEVVASVMKGMPEEALARVLDYAGDRPDWGKPEEQAKSANERWIRDRLALIQGSLDSATASFLASLIAQHGEPLDLAALVSRSYSYTPVYVSPLTAEQIQKMSPAEVRDFVCNWTPSRRISIPEEESLAVLGKILFQLHSAKAKGALNCLVKYARINPQVTIGILVAAKEAHKNTKLPFSVIELYARVSRYIVDRVSQGQERLSEWDSCMQEIVTLPRDVLPKDEDKPSPPESVTALILMLDGIVLHYDGSSNDFESSDVAAAISSTRSSAFIARVTLTYRVQLASLTNGTERNNVVDGLDRFLNAYLAKRERLVATDYTAIALCLSALLWSNHQWVLRNIDSIIYPPHDDQAHTLSDAAWRGLISPQIVGYSPSYLNLLAPYIPEAIERLVFIDPKAVFEQEHWAGILVHYLLFQEQPSPVVSRHILRFFETAPERSISTWGRIVWQLAHSFSSAQWSIFMQFWSHRLDHLEANPNAAIHRGDLLWYLRLLSRNSEFVPLPAELTRLKRTLSAGSSLLRDDAYPLMELERYLMAWVERDPQCVMDLFETILGIEYSMERHNDDDPRKPLLERLVQNPLAKARALTALDILLSRGVYTYKDVYNANKE